MFTRQIPYGTVRRTHDMTGTTRQWSDELDYAIEQRELGIEAARDGYRGPRFVDWMNTYGRDPNGGGGMYGNGLSGAHAYGTPIPGGGTTQPAMNRPVSQDANVDERSRPRVVLDALLRAAKQNPVPADENGDGPRDELEGGSGDRQCLIYLINYREMIFST